MKRQGIWTIVLLSCILVIFSSAKADLTYTTNLAVWLKADAGIVLDGTKVQTWQDQATGAIGNGTSEDATASAGGPTVVTGAILGHDAVYYGGGGAHSFIGSLGISGSNVTIFAVSQETSNLTQSGLFSVGDVTGGTGDAVVGGDVGGADGTATFRYNAGFYTVTNGPVANSPMITAWEIETGDTHNSVRYWGNGFLGVVQTGVNPNNTITLADNGYVLGSLVSGTGGHASFYQGYLAEILIYTGTLTDEEKNQVGYYLETKYGMDTVYTPEPATISLLLAGGLGILRRHRR